MSLKKMIVFVNFVWRKVYKYYDRRSSQQKTGCACFFFLLVQCFDPSCSLVINLLLLNSLGNVNKKSLLCYRLNNNKQGCQKL
jgi:hypothetical protein